jgi:uncharacterized protein YciI
MAHRTRLPALLALLALALLLAALPVAAQEHEEGAAPMEFDVYQLVLLKRPAEPTEMPDEEIHRIQAAHLAHMTQMAKEGKLVSAGPFGDQENESLRGLALYRVGSIEEARRLAAADPAVQAGRLEVEVMTWYTEKGSLAFPGAEKLRAEAGRSEPVEPPDPD